MGVPANFLCFTESNRGVQLQKEKAPIRVPFLVVALGNGVRLRAVGTQVQHLPLLCRNSPRRWRFRIDSI